MHPDTLDALRRLALALTTHPEDVATLAIYGNLPENLADALDDYDDTEED